MKISISAKALFVSAALASAAGCASHQEPLYVTGPPPRGYTVVGEVTVAEPPPPPMTETIIAAPGPGFVWVGGYWGWAGDTWRWQRGYWAHPPHRGAVWVGPRYYTRGGRLVWTGGTWH